MQTTEIHPIPSSEARKYEHYKLTSEDITQLMQSIGKLLTSEGIFDPGTLDGMRIITFDSQYSYIFTQGEHASSDRVKIEDKTSQLLKDQENPHRIRIYRTSHDKNRDDLMNGSDDSHYRGAVAWVQPKGLAETVVDTEKGLVSGYTKAFTISPYGPYMENAYGIYDYTYSAVFHEAGHLEEGQMHYYIKLADSKNAKEKLEQVIEDSDSALEIKKFLLEEHEITRRDLAEAYAMMIEQEARWRAGELPEVKNDPGEQEEDYDWLDHEIHTVGVVLRFIFENTFHDYQERKAWFQEILKGN